MPKLDGTDLDVFPLCLGGNVFGWTADEDASFAVLDAYVAAGGNFIDTADTYMRPNLGTSETIIGRWMAARGNRDQLVIATKVGSDGGLSARNVAEHAAASLRRLQTDRIDLYYSHKDDLDVPVEETLRAYGELVDAGQVRYIGASNLSGERILESLRVSAREGLPSYVALQPHYNLVERERYETEYAPIVASHELSVAPYYALAKGFLTGKYRAGGPDVESPRAEGARAYLDERGERVLADLDEIAAAHDTTVSAAGLAWLLSRPGVVAPIASATSVAQLEELLPMAGLTLTGDELLRLEISSR
jgi:aryl-alcohol dehydrogenase-like predicted oxidoreductase